MTHLTASGGQNVPPLYGATPLRDGLGPLPFGAGMRNPPDVLVGVPLYGYTPVRAQIGLTHWLLGEVDQGSFRGLHTTEELYVTKARNDICAEAIETDRSHVLFIDSDVVPPVGAVRRLVLHNKPIVGGIYYQKLPGHAPVAGKWAAGGDNPYDSWRPLEHVRPGLQRVEVIGAGLLLITRRVLIQIREKFGPTWFDAPSGRGEDIEFCMKAAECGIGVYADAIPGVQHVGTVNVTPDYFVMARWMRACLAAGLDPESEIQRISELAHG